MNVNEAKIEDGFGRWEEKHRMEQGLNASAELGLVSNSNMQYGRFAFGHSYE